MGRVKLKIKKLESSNNRQVTFSKRRSGILKKAKELSILCDIHIVLLMFSPTEKPTLFLGERSNLEEVIAKFASLTPQERAKRKLESLEALKKTFKKLDHDVNIQDFLDSRHSVEELSSQVRMLQAQLTEVHRRLSCWSNPDKIDNIDHLSQMENSIRELLHQIQMQKENFVKRPLVSLECTSQFQDRVHLPLVMGSGPEVQPLPWLPSNENQHMMLTGEPSFLPQREGECSSSHSLHTYSGFFNSGKTEIENSRQVDRSGHGGSSLSELDSVACLRQLNEQFPYQPYGSLDIPEARKLKTEPGMNLQGNSLDYQVNHSFQLPRPIYDDVHHTWVPPSDPCTVSMFHEDSYSQRQTN
ncbi:hypothetical protein NMG60_11004247 [Bertholletia excelsa]